jgi:hypothetical protein
VASEVSCLVAIVNMMGQPHPRLWPDAAFGNVGLPTFMEFLPTCGHCLESGEGSNGARALAHTQREALATLQSAAAALGAAALAVCGGHIEVLRLGVLVRRADGLAEEASSLSAGSGWGAAPEPAQASSSSWSGGGSGRRGPRGMLKC